MYIERLKHLKRHFHSLPPEAQLLLIVRFSHNLAIATRDIHECGTSDVPAPQRLRDVAEIQLCLLQYILALGTGETRPDSGEHLISTMLEPNDEYLRAQAEWAFEKALRQDTA